MIRGDGDGDIKPVKKELPPEQEAIEGLKKAGCVSKWMIAVAAVPLVFYFSNLRNQIADMEKEIKEKTAIIADQKESIANLEKAIALQNAEVTKYQEKAQEADEQRDELIVDLKEDAERSNQEVLRILKGVKPKTCEDSRKFLQKFAEDIKW